MNHAVKPPAPSMTRPKTVSQTKRDVASPRIWSIGWPTRTIQGVPLIGAPAAIAGTPAGVTYLTGSLVATSNGIGSIVLTRSFQRLPSTFAI
jgi:hypothetical protein